MFNCDLCSKPFNKRQGLLMHRRMAHPQLKLNSDSHSSRSLAGKKPVKGNARGRGRPVKSLSSVSTATVAESLDVPVLVQEMNKEVEKEFESVIKVEPDKFNPVEPLNVKYPRLDKTSNCASDSDISGAAMITIKGTDADVCNEGKENVEMTSKDLKRNEDERSGDEAIATAESIFATTATIEDAIKVKETNSVPPEEDSNEYALRQDDTSCDEGMPSLDLYAECNMSDNSRTSSSYGSPPTLSVPFPLFPLPSLAVQDSHVDPKQVTVSHHQELNDKAAAPSSSSVCNIVVNDKSLVSESVRSDSTVPEPLKNTQRESKSAQTSSTTAAPQPSPSGQSGANRFVGNSYFAQPMMIHRPPGYPCPNQIRYGESRRPPSLPMFLTFNGDIAVPFPSLELLRELGRKDARQKREAQRDQETSVVNNSVPPRPTKKIKSNNDEETNQKVKCPECGNEYINNTNLNRHARKAHRMEFNIK